jgi:hypothetical protein
VKPAAPQPEIRKKDVQKQQPKGKEEKEEGVQDDRAPGGLPEKPEGRGTR